MCRTYRIALENSGMFNEHYITNEIYRIDSNIDDIQNQTDVNLEEMLSQDVARIEWNYLRRRYLTEDGYANLYSYLRRYRNLVVEVLMRTKRVYSKVTVVESYMTSHAIVLGRWRTIRNGNRRNDQDKSEK